MTPKNPETECPEVCQQRLGALEEKDRNQILVWEAIKKKVSVNILLPLSSFVILLFIAWMGWLTIIQVSEMRNSNNANTSVIAQLSLINTNLSVLSENVKLRLKIVEDRQADVYNRVRDAENERFKQDRVLKGK